MDYKNTYVANDYITNGLAKKADVEQQFCICKSDKNKVRTATIERRTVRCIMNEDGDIIQKLGVNYLTPDMRMVLDDIQTLIENNLFIDAVVENTDGKIENVKIFTPEMLIRIENGNNKKARITENRKKEIRETIRLLSETYVELSDDQYMESMVLNSKFKIKKIKITGDYLLSLKDVVVVAKNGKEVRGYILKENPFIYRYLADEAKKMGRSTQQIICIDNYWLNPSCGCFDRRSALIRIAIMRRIFLLANPRNKIKQTTMLYESVNNDKAQEGGLLREIGVVRTKDMSDSAWRKLKSSANKDILKVCDEILEKSQSEQCPDDFVGLINEFRLVTEGKSHRIKSLEIIPGEKLERIIEKKKK